MDLSFFNHRSGSIKVNFKKKLVFLSFNHGFLSINQIGGLGECVCVCVCGIFIYRKVIVERIDGCPM